MRNNDRNFTLKQLNKHLHGLTGLVLCTKEQSFEQVGPTYVKFRTYGKFRTLECTTQISEKIYI